MKIALAAILRNEADYLLEWIAWHRNIGFTHFFITDNESDDGTRELLEQLRDCGIVRLRSEPRGAEVQAKAYKAMLSAWGRDVDRIAFLDGDEFLVSADERSPIEHLEALIAPRDVGAVAINWRLFGSSGHKERGDGLVIERFTRCAPDDHAICRHFKTYARPQAIVEQRAHHAKLLPTFRYVDVANRPVVFVSPKGNVHLEGTGLLQTIGPASVRVHHYVVKSLQEFNEKKRARGHAIMGPTHDHGDGYFRNHDLNDRECLFAHARSEATQRTVEQLKLMIESRKSKRPPFWARWRKPA